jgi:hypothetical protein
VQTAKHAITFISCELTPIVTQSSNQRKKKNGENNPLFEEEKNICRDF